MPPTRGAQAVARVSADASALEAAADVFDRLRPARQRALENTQHALYRYFATAPLYGPTYSDVDVAVRRYIDDAHFDAIGLGATADAFRQADRVRPDVAVSPWVVTNAWVEAQRRL